MWLLFDSGALVAYSKAGAAPAEALTLDLRPAAREALYRACHAGRVSLVGGVLHLDGAPFTEPPVEPAVTYSQAIAAINGSNLPAGLKAWMRLVTELLLDHGKVDL